MEEEIEFPFRPYFGYKELKKSTIIGAETDYTPFYELLEYNLFSFNLDGHQILNQDIIKYLRAPSFERLYIRCNIEYHAEPLGVESYIVSGMVRGHNHPIEFLYDIMVDMISRLKQSMFLKHSFKKEMDALNNSMHKMLRDGAMYRSSEIDYISNRLEDMNTKIDTGLDSVIFRKTKKTIPDNPNPVAPPSKEEESFEDIEKRLEDAGKSFKLDLKAIRTLHKAKSNKFVLPLHSNNKDEYEKWNTLSKQPFNFLSYNGSMFSMDLRGNVKDMWVQDPLFGVDESLWHNLWNERFDKFREVRDNVDKKIINIKSRQAKLRKIQSKLSVQVNDLKRQFVKRSNKYKNPKLMKFMASRTETNIKTIREAGDIAYNKVEVLKKKQLVKNPTKFFKRAVRLYLGKTGEDIMEDMAKLKIKTKKAHKIAINYLYFLMHLIEEREDKYTPPVLPILNDEEFEAGFNEIEILKILTGHMFVHTVTLTKKDTPAPPEAPPARIVTG